MPSLSAIDPSIALLRRDAAEHAEALLAERRRAAAAAANARTERNVLARTARAPRREDEPTVLDFREPEPEVLRYRRARDARDVQADEAAASYTPAAGPSRYDVELRVAVEPAGAAQGAPNPATPQTAQPPPLVAAAIPVPDARQAARAYAALTPDTAQRAAVATASDDYEAMRLATRRQQANSAYRAVERPVEYTRVRVLA